MMKTARLKHLFTAFLTVLLMAVATPSLASGWMPKDCQVNITADGAEMHFPAIYRQHMWTWFQNETRDDALEYSFEVLFKSGDNTRGLGFYLFKLGGMQPVSGKPEDFFSQGRVMAWTKMNSGRRLVPVKGIDMHLADGRIVLSIKGQDTLKALFGNGPRAALFSTLHPDPKLTYGCVAKVPSNLRQASLR